MAEWPGIPGLSGYHEGIYLAVLFGAWAYILSVRWGQSLEAVTNQRCECKYTPVDDLEHASRTDPRDLLIDLGPGVDKN